MIADAIYFSQYLLHVWIGVYSLTVDLMLNSASGGVSPGSGVATPYQIEAKESDKRKNVKWWNDAHRILSKL
jgi:hypothetical protein